MVRGIEKLLMARALTNSSLVPFSHFFSFLPWNLVSTAKSLACPHKHYRENKKKGTRLPPPAKATLGVIARLEPTLDLYAHDTEVLG